MGVMIRLKRQKNELLFLSGNDIPFPEGQLIICPPKIKDIAYVGEDAFFIGLELWKFTKDLLNDEDKIRLSNLSNFSIFMQILLDKSKAKENHTDFALIFLDLLFPQYKVSFNIDSIIFTSENGQNGFINEKNFESFQDLLEDIFPFSKEEKVQFNPQGTLAENIAKKLAERQKKLANYQSQSSQKIAIFSRYISILTVGEQKDMNSFMLYTVYQLLDEFERFQLKTKYEVNIQVRLAGASGDKLEEPEDWMKDLYTSDFKGAYEKK